MSNPTPASPLRDWLADPAAGQVLRGLLASEGQSEQALAPVTTYRTPRALAGLAAVGLLALTGCGTEAGADPASNSSPSGEGRGIRATQVAHVTDVHEATGMTLLEGPVLMENGDLYVVDVTAPRANPRSSLST